MKFDSEQISNGIIALFFNHPELCQKSDVKIFNNGKEILKGEFESNFSQDKKIENENLENNLGTLNNQITLENVSDSLDRDKLYEIFFIYGDIIEIILKKQEV